MKLKDRLKIDKVVLASLQGRSKALFVWDYYKIPIITAASVLLLALLAVLTWAGKRDVAMYAVFVNSDAGLVQTKPELLDELLIQGGVNMDGKAIDITADLALGQDKFQENDGQTIQVLAALFGISGLDVFAAEQESFDRYAVQDAFVDLSLLLEPELYEQDGCEPYWYENSEGRNILGGIILKPGSMLHEAGYYHADVVLGVAANAENLEEAVTFVQQLLMAQMIRK